MSRARTASFSVRILYTPPVGRGLTGHVNGPHTVLQAGSGVAPGVHHGDAAAGHVDIERAIGVPGARALSVRATSRVEGHPCADAAQHVPSTAAERVDSRRPGSRTHTAWCQTTGGSRRRGAASRLAGRSGRRHRSDSECPRCSGTAGQHSAHEDDYKMRVASVSTHMAGSYLCVSFMTAGLTCRHGTG